MILPGHVMNGVYRSCLLLCLVIFATVGLRTSEAKAQIVGTEPWLASILSPSSKARLPDSKTLELGVSPAPRLTSQGGEVVVLGGLPDADRRGTSVTVVPDGRVLIFGGLSSDGRLLTQAHWFDVASKSFKPATEELPPARAGHAALVLTDGRVLFAGGVDARLALIEGAQLWDPRSGAITALARDALVDRVGATATLLTDGHVLDRRRTRSPGSSHACRSAAH